MKAPHRSKEARRILIRLEAVVVVVVCGGMAWAVFAQSADARYDRPTELGIRFTPPMAEALARGYIANVAVPRYELGDEKVDEATEAVARRLMAAAHSLDTPEQQASVERMYAGILNAIADNADQPAAGIPPAMGMALGQGIKPLLPAVREVLRGMGDDLRPMLPLKHQLALGRDLLSAGMAIDAFENTMERWAQGDVQPFENPFRPQDAEIEIDDQGRSSALNNAMQFAQRMVDHPPWESEWERYVEQAKEYYQFDESQAAAADSQLREALQQAERIAQNDRWQRLMYRNRLWEQLARRVLHLYGPHPVPLMVSRSQRSAMDPITRLGDTMKLRIERIATTTQRRQAEQRMMQLIADHGFAPEDF